MSLLGNVGKAPKSSFKFLGQQARQPLQSVHSAECGSCSPREAEQRGVCCVCPRRAWAVPAPVQHRLPTAGACRAQPCTAASTSSHTATSLHRALPLPSTSRKYLAEKCLFLNPPQLLESWQEELHYWMALSQSTALCWACSCPGKTLTFHG